MSINIILEFEANCKLAFEKILTTILGVGNPFLRHLSYYSQLSSEQVMLVNKQKSLMNLKILSLYKFQVRALVAAYRWWFQVDRDKYLTIKYYDIWEEEKMSDSDYQILQRRLCRRLDFELYGYDPEPFLWMASQQTTSWLSDSYLIFITNITHKWRKISQVEKFQISIQVRKPQVDFYAFIHMSRECKVKLE